MATAAENRAKLELRKQQILTELSTLVSKPDYNADGESVQWSAYRKSLLDELDKIEDLLVRLSGPWMVTSYGRAGA